MAEESWTAPQLESPPRARPAFRVGTVGHRPNRLEQADLAVLANVLHKEPMSMGRTHHRGTSWEKIDHEVEQNFQDFRELNVQ